MALFLSDNVTAACPEVMDAVVAANSGAVLSYGDDAISASLQARLAEVFETEVKVYLTVTGTASNALALSALTPPYGKVSCHELAHINTDECAAPELFTGGAKLVPLRGENGKFSAPGLAASISGRGNLHNAQPAVVSITQSTEAGTVYQLDEIAAIGATAREHGLKVHMDGARFTNGLVALDASPAQMTWQAGVDVLSFGGTKNGCLAAEAIVFFDTALAQDFAYLHKRSGQLLSKMRFIAAQLQAYLHGGVWLRNARQANAMAARLSAGLAALPGIELAYPTQSNEVFVRLPATVLEGLQAEGIAVNGGELDGSAERFVAAWNTSTVEVDNLLGAIARYCADSRQGEGDHASD
jgi:threonine aldolase